MAIPERRRSSRVRSPGGRERVVAVASDGGDCYEHDYRARVDTTAAQDWIRQTIADVLGRER